MISKYSKQMQINSNMVIYFTFEYLTWTKRKRSQFIFKLRRRSVLPQMGKNVFPKSTRRRYSQLMVE